MPTVWYFFAFRLFLIGLGTRPTVWYLFDFLFISIGIRN